MSKRKREDDDNDYVDFCSGLKKTSSDGIGNNSYVYSMSRPFKRPKINPNIYQKPTVHYTKINPDEKKYQEIKNLITNKNLVIDELIRVKNSMLEDAYYAKKKQKMKEYGGDVEEALLFHGTKECNVDTICTYNFDWRLTGVNRGHKFGQGVNFSPNAKYASNYSDPKYKKVMIVAKVLIGRVCKGHHDMSIPPEGYDTSAKGRGVVLVKYEDNEFFPAYILRYHFEKYSRCRLRRQKEINRQQYNHDSGYHSGSNNSLTGRGPSSSNSFDRSYQNFCHGVQENNYCYNNNNQFGGLDPYQNFYGQQNYYLNNTEDFRNLNFMLNQLLYNTQIYNHPPRNDFSYDGNYCNDYNYYSFN